jgi:hypothetical protein
MYTKEQIKRAFATVFRGAGELWFPYAGLDTDIMQPVDEHWTKLDAALAASPLPVMWACSGQSDTASIIPLTQRALKLDHDATAMQRLLHDIATPQPRPRVLVVGARRFHRDAAPTLSVSSWTWEHMLRLPAMSPQRTPLAWQRLHDVGLDVADAIDLMPPGGDVDEAQACQQARYLQGVLAGLEAAERGYDYVVLLGGKVSKAFRAADTRLADLRLLELRHGFITLPTPHVVEQDADGWWSSEVKLGRLRHVVEKLMSWRCQECVNGDGEVQGCIACGTHAAGCERGEFCVQCRKRAS